ncbi:ATP-binding protein [Flavisolibacter nicotianae]|uniref:ATP-binding protein n=1 Tax=Flavisolibacter nicotianae TaxID=2364882 RepID=UPI000EAE2158|nr:ATP-binding protein [Flavisolibacter nicotianae]
MEKVFLQNQKAERYKTALEAAGIGIWDNDLLTDKIFFSGNSHELFGLPSNKNVSLDQIFANIHPADRERVKTKLKSSLDPAVRALYENEYRIINPATGLVVRWIRTKGRAYFTDKGTPYRVTGTVQDITAEIKAREVQQKLLALVDNSIELMSILENDQKNSYINKAGMEMLGFDTLEQVYQTPISELHTPEDIAFVEANVLPGVIGTGKWSGIMHVRHLKTGEVFPVYNNTVRIHDNTTGEPIAIGAVMRDIRPEMAAQKALEESVRNFQTLVMQAPVGMCIFKGEELFIEIANDNFQFVANKNTAAMVGKRVAEVFPEAQNQGFDNMLLTVLQTRQPLKGKEVEIVQEREGSARTIFVDFTIQPLFEGDGTVNRIMCVAIDVTDKVLAKKTLQESEEELASRVAERTKELERKNKELEEFTYVSSHDLQEPLRKIKMFREMIRERDYEHLSAFSKEKFDKIGESVDRMSRSLKDLLNFASLDKEENTEKVDLNPIIENVKNDLELIIEQKKATVICDKLPSINAIPLQIHQLFYNLINNALKFSNPDTPPRITIKWESNGVDPQQEVTVVPAKEYCTISVSDNGIGFAQQNAAKIFGMFQRLHARSAYEGTGVGLALCKKIAQNHGGSIWVESSPGQGAKFSVLLPM